MKRFLLLIPLLFLGWIVSYHAYDLIPIACPFHCELSEFGLEICPQSTTLQACWDTVDYGIMFKQFKKLNDAVAFMQRGKEYDHPYLMYPGMNLINWNLIYEVEP